MDSNVAPQSPFLTPITINSGTDRVVEKSRAVDDDFEVSRKNLILMMDVTRGAIQQLSILAAQSQMPEAFDVLNKTIKTYNEQQAQLLQMWKMGGKGEVKGNDKPVEASVVDNRTQNLFVGTPAELAKVLEARGQ